MDCRCAPMFRFSLWCQMAPQQSAKFITAFFGQFRTSLRKDSIASYASIWTLFTSVTGPDVLCNALTISQIRLQVAPQDIVKIRKIFGRDFAKRKQTDAEFAGNSQLRMFIIDIVSNTSLGGLTLDPAGMQRRCFCFLVFFVFFLSRSEDRALFVRGVHSSNKALRCRLQADFDAVFSFFFRIDSPFRCTIQFSFLSLGGAISFAKLRSKISKSSKIGEKVFAHDFVQIAERFEEYTTTAVVQGRECVHLYKIKFQHVAMQR